MSCTNFFSTTNNDIDNCYHLVDICDDVMSCACCGYFLEKHKQIVVDELIKNLPFSPSELTRIKIPLYPLPANRYYYSFDGISTIIYNLLKTDNAKQKKSVEKHQTFLKVYYEKNNLFNLPVIQIEVLFIGRLNPKAIDEYWKTLKAEVLFFTGSVGDIDIIKIRGFKHLHELFKIPLLFGYPEFKNEGVLKENGFTPKQIREMNYLHTMQLLPMEMSKVINNNTLELFSIQKEAILKEDMKINNEYDESLDEDVINVIFGNRHDNDIKKNIEDFDDLPF
jgi:hypothetical protein